MEPLTENKGKTRLMITKMILENFKSYAGAQEIGPFHKRFSSVVGPNGSGKSNVIDALLFVFGKRAKQLRLDKVSQLIHKSASFPNLQYAKVEVHFQLIHDDESSEDDFEVVPGSEFIVSRTADMKNQSKYTVDGKGSTYTEVGLLLRKHGIDLDNNRFLILQGEVEQIAMMKPKALSEHEDGLLEYLEDIIGSNKFVEKIDEIGKTLETLNEERVDKVTRLKAAERERDGLSSSKAEAEAFMEREREIRRRKNVMLQLQESSALLNVKEFAVRRNEAKAQLDQEKSNMKDGEQQLVILEKEYEDKKKDYDTVMKELEGANLNFAAYERKDLELQENMKHCGTQINKLRVAVSRDLKKEEDCLREAEEALVLVTNTKDKIAEAEQSKQVEQGKLEEILEGLRGATQTLRDSLEETQVQLADAERATASIQTEKEGVETGLQLSRSRSDAAVQAVIATEIKISQLREEAQRGVERVKSLEGEKRELLQQIADMQTQGKKCQGEEATVQTSLRSAVTSLEEARAALLSQQQSGPKGRNKELDQLTAAAKKGGPLEQAGLWGRLGDLATISPEYDVAISTCCAMLDYLVVDTTEGGQACINYLRERNIGRANFIVLDQLGQHKAGIERSQKTAIPAGAKRVLDLVIPSSPTLIPAFYMALRDTLVASDLESAVAIAYQGGRAMWRVVTTDGNLIDISGSMSGGGKSVRSGGMLLSGTALTKTSGRVTEEESVTPQQISALEGKVAQCEAQLALCRATKRNSELAVKDGCNRLKAIEIELEKLTISLSRLQEQEGELTTRLNDLNKGTALSPAEKKEMAALEARILNLDQHLIRTAPDILTLRRAALFLQQQIRAEGGPKLARAQARVDGLAAQLQLLSKMMITKEVEQASCRKQATKASASFLKGQTDLSKAEEKLAVYQQEVGEMEEDALLMIQAQDAARESAEKQEGMLGGLTTKYNVLEGKVKKMREVEGKLGEELQKAERDLKSNTGDAKGWRDMLDAVREEHIGEQREFNASVREVLKAVKISGTSSSSAGQGSEESIMEEEKEEEETLELLPDISAEELQRGSEEAAVIAKEIGILEAERARQQKEGDGLNMVALMDWIRKNGQYRLRVADLEASTLLRNIARKEFETLRGQRLEMFMGGFGIITLKLKEMYQMITLGGDAELELLDSLDPFSEGIVFSVRPPKKSWKNISNLSGGEKTLSSLALVFALHHYKPTPLYVMDEIDAALDFKNVSIVANYIKDRTKNAQFVIISLRNNMFELADRLVGIYKTNDATKSVTINPRMFAEASIKSKLMLGQEGQKNEEDDFSIDREDGQKGSGRPRVILGDATNLN